VGSCNGHAPLIIQEGRARDGQIPQPRRDGQSPDPDSFKHTRAERDPDPAGMDILAKESMLHTECFGFVS
jgi:hypothetical protein